VQDHYLNETSAFRKFEGEEDKNHHGPAHNDLFSSSHNLRTAIAGGRGTDTLRRTADYVEMNLSQFGKDERRTRIGYKDQQKKKAFDKMKHLSSSLNLHDTVLDKAQVMFSGYRNAMEHVHQFPAVIAACVISAWRGNMPLH